LVFFQDTTGHNKRNVRFLHLSNVHHIETAGGGSGMLAFSSPKLSIGSYLGDILLVFRASGASKDRDDLLKFLQKALERKAWEIQSRLHEKKTASQAIAARKVGVVRVFGGNCGYCLILRSEGVVANRVSLFPSIKRFPTC